MKQIRENPKFPEALVQRCLNLGGHLPDGRIAVGERGDLHEAERACHQVLSSRIVQLKGDPSPLVLLQHKQLLG